MFFQGCRTDIFQHHLCVLEVRAMSVISGAIFFCDGGYRVSAVKFDLKLPCKNRGVCFHRKIVVIFFCYRLFPTPQRLYALSDSI